MQQEWVVDASVQDERPDIIRGSTAEKVVVKMQFGRGSLQRFELTAQEYMQEVAQRMIVWAGRDDMPSDDPVAFLEALAEMDLIKIVERGTQ